MLDNRASHHLTGDATQLENTTPFHGQEGVTIGNGSKLPISHIGTSAISTSNYDLILKNILHAPQSSANLLSVHKLCIQ